MLGPFGVRVNQWTSENGDLAMKSPYRKDFSWNERVVWAACEAKRCPTLISTYPGSIFEEVPEAIDIGDDCHCGIYVAFDLALAYSYHKDVASAVYCLCEGLGTVHVGSEGFRASGVQVVKVIDVVGTWQRVPTRPGTQPWITLHATARHYDVGIVTWAEAQACINTLKEQYFQKFIDEEQQNERHTDSGL